MNTRSHAAILAAALLCAAPAAFAASHMTRAAVSRDEARTLILGDNYTDVTNLQSKNGGWTADAKESGKPVHLFVNSMEEISVM